MKLIIRGNVKQKKNNKRVVYNKKTGKPFIMTEKKTTDYIHSAVEQLKTQFAGCKISEYPISVHMTFYYETKHRKDIDNSATTILDCMKDAGVIDDDNVNYVNKLYSCFGGYDKENPRVEIFLED